MSTTAVEFRRADPGDKEAIQRISADAYVPGYMAVLGTIPKPAREDYGPRIDKGEVWIWKLKVSQQALLSSKRGQITCWSTA
jgi:hypothetical protein